LNHADSLINRGESGDSIEKQDLIGSNKQMRRRLGIEVPYPFGRKAGDLVEQEGLGAQDTKDNFGAKTSIARVELDGSIKFGLEGRGGEGFVFCNAAKHEGGN